MRNIILTLCATLLGVVVFGQAPEAIPYQAIARTSGGAIIAGTTISVRFSIIDSIINGTVIYRETHSVTTSAQGMFTANVGTGMPTLGTFSGIRWGKNDKFMQVEIDPAGGSSFVDIGRQQLMSVPFALSARSVALSTSATGDSLLTGAGNFVIIPGISAANRPPAPGPISGADLVCVGSPLALSNSLSGGTWTSSNAANATVGTSGIVSGVTAGTTIISYTVTNGFGTATVTKVLTVSALPSAGSITGTTAIFAGNTTTLTNATSGGTWSSGNTSVASVGTAGMVTGIAAGTAVISYTVTNSCGSAFATRTVTVSPALAIGDSYGGGKVAYIFVPGDPGYVSGETHGLIAATADQSTGMQWYNGTNITTGATSTALGTGMSNTNTIVSAQGTGTYAAKLCADLVTGGYSDWYLPSRDELNKLYLNKTAIGGFSANAYWSSTEHESYDAWGINLGSGFSSGSYKSDAYRVRAIRTF